MQFRSRNLRLLRQSSLFWLLIALLSLTWFLFAKQTGGHIFFFAPAERWTVDQGLGCPPALGSTSGGSGKSYAPAVSPAELLCRPLATNLSSTPKLLHQTWKSAQLPAKFERWSRTCREQNSDWEWVLWSDDDNLLLLRKYFPWLEDTYQALPGDIYRVDLVRNMYMYIFGG